MRPDSAGQDHPPRGHWGTFWAALVVAFLVLGAWAFASPAMASPDEPAHAAKAAATVRGQFFADESRYNPGRGEFELPKLFNTAWKLPCYAFHPDVTAGCMQKVIGQQDSIERVPSHVERYNPLYYAIVGLPSLFHLSEWTFTWMRLMSALLNAVLIALTVRILAGLRRPALPLLAVLAALTPMTMFIGSSITPQGPEVFGAALVIVTMLAMLFESSESQLRGRAWTLVIGVLFFAMARGLSPAYLALAVVAVILVAPRMSTVGEVVRNRVVWLPLGLCVVLTAAAGFYTLLSGSLALGVVYPDPTLTTRGVVVKMLGNTDYYLEQIFGTFGWGDTHLPMWVLQLIGGIALLVGVLGVALGRWRQRVVILAVVIGAILFPIAVQLVSFHESGLVWQGKYVLPLAMLAPLIAGFAAGSSGRLSEADASITRVGALIVAIAQVAAVAVNLHRYVNGANGPWLSLVDGAWTPLVPIAVILGTAAAGWALAFAGVCLLTRPTSSSSAPHRSGSSADSIPAVT